ncbi:hypothetical protein LXM94_01270 [Rhizobium sp. TRM95111]|uniref:hypothetical protein n=1 Tax=Rhizobium alarense TaxID=2846851 RepID=UPI001F4632D6|nr:hypothetical protein [Rhizobium alarense]MCF3638599.1 hypothetical protein [Rhizobium alarense]
MADSGTDATEANEKITPKQAVIVIHGMGEQVPMTTLRSFVDAVWTTDRSLINANRKDSNTGEARTGNPIWSRPDDRNRSYELRRITTETADDGRKTDFYEFYWAHLMEGTTSEHLAAWIGDLLLRRPRRVPADVMPVWIVMWLVAIAVAVAAVAGTYSAFSREQAPWLAGFSAAVGVALAAGYLITQLVRRKASQFMLGYFGDVARYVKATPPNVARRQEIREKGVELLETILLGAPMADGRLPPSGERRYERVVVVAHSLGTIVAYDILKHTFARMNDAFTAADGQPCRAELEAYLRDTTAADFRIDRFQALQRACLDELKGEGHPWVVTDFVTLGSPLTHAEFLLAFDEADLLAQQQERILPTCPPTLEWNGTTKLRHFTYPRLRSEAEEKAEKALPADERRAAANAGRRNPHHAAHFAYTRWTNLHSKSWMIAWGDMISGPVGSHFALVKGAERLMGAKDVAVLPQRDQNGAPMGNIPFFTHTKYWDMTVRTGPADKGEVPHHILELRNALQLSGG